MRLEEITEQSKFDDFVKSHESGSFLQSWEWGQWQDSLGHEVLRYFVIENGATLLSAQILKTKIPKLNKYYLYIPYGPLVVKSEKYKVESVLKFFFEEQKKNFSDAIFIRVEPKDDFPLSTFNFQLTSRIQPGKTLLLDLSKSVDELLAGMHPKTRYNIKVAQKHGVKVVSEPIITPGHGLHLKEVADLLVGTAERQGYKSHGRIYYQKLIDFFGQRPQADTRLTVYRALYEQKLLACSIMVDFGQTRTYLFGGTSPESKNVMAPYAMHWQAVLDAKNSGLTAYDFWGIETAKGETPGFVRFKRGFGGTEIGYPEANDLVLNRVWYNAYKVLRKINQKLAR